MATSNAKPGDTVELKDKEVGFSDWESAFDISRSQKKKLGDVIGQRTHEAILSGGLLIVKSGKSKEDEDDSTTDGYDLPADLPGRDAFVAAGYTSFAQVKDLDTEEKLLAVKGIGPGTVKNLTAWAKANLPKE